MVSNLGREPRDRSECERIPRAPRGSPALRPPPQRLGVSVADWTAILASVTEIAISIDGFDDADTIGLDNFSLESSTVPVPEPGTLSLLQ